VNAGWSRGLMPQHAATRRGQVTCTSLWFMVGAARHPPCLRRPTHTRSSRRIGAARATFAVLQRSFDDERGEGVRRAPAGGGEDKRPVSANASWCRGIRSSSWASASTSSEAFDIFSIEEATREGCTSGAGGLRQPSGFPHGHRSWSIVSVIDHGPSSRSSRHVRTLDRVEAGTRSSGTAGGV
jgi:hypothetical protein